MAIKVEHGDHNFVIKFDHKNIPIDELNGQYGFIIPYGYLSRQDDSRLCSIAQIEIFNRNDQFGDPEDVFEGIAVVNPSDNFCKITGRKLALVDVLSIMKVSGLANKELRTKIWEAYKNNCKFNKKKKIYE